MDRQVALPLSAALATDTGVTTPRQMEVRTSWVVVCGLIRDEAAFRVKLDTLARWKAEGHIEDVVVSTWTGEIDRYPALLEAHARGEFILVEANPPDLRIMGHALHQARSLYYGLQAVPEGVRVLKTRPDIGELLDHVLTAFVSVDLTLAPRPGWPEVFSSRILVAGFCLEAPFYINDIIFFGLREDLLRLANFDLSTEYLCNHMVAEQFIFRAAFAGRFPLLEAYLQIAPPFLAVTPAEAEARLDLLFASDAFWDAFALNLRFMAHYFRVGLVADELRPPDDHEGRALDLRALLSGTEDAADAAYNPVSHFTTAYGEDIIRTLLCGRFVRDDAGRRLEAALERTSDPDYWRAYSANPLKPEPAIRALQRVASDRYPAFGDRLAVEATGPRRHRVGGFQDRLSVIRDAEKIDRQADEIRRLKRRVETLEQAAARRWTVKARRAWRRLTTTSRAPGA